MDRLSAAHTYVRLDDKVVAELPFVNDDAMRRPHVGFVRPIPVEAK